MKRCVLLLALLCLCLVQAYAGEYVYNGQHFMYEVEDGGAVLVEYWITPGRPTPAEVLIPAEVDGIPMRAIARYAFELLDRKPYQGRYIDRFEWRDIQRIVVPEGVTTLQEGAFEQCQHIPCIALPSTLTTIEDGATFLYVEAAIELPNGNPYYTVENGFLIDQRSSTLVYSSPASAKKELPAVQRLGSYALVNYLAGRTELVLPDTVTYVGSFNAYECSELKQIVIPGSVEELADYAFAYCEAESVVLQEGVKRIGAAAFLHLPLTAVTVPASVAWIGYDAFYDVPKENLTLLNPDTHREKLMEYMQRNPHFM